MDLSVCLGPHQFTTTFQVMNIHPDYSCLLGRLWIHVIGAITSILHQKLKFMFGDKLVIVCDDDDFMISELSSFWYVKIKEGIIEVPFHYLDFEDVNSVSVNQSQSSTMVLFSAKNAKKTLEKGLLSGWDQNLKVAEKHDRFGLGYHPTSRHPCARGVRSSI